MTELFGCSQIIHPALFFSMVLRYNTSNGSSIWQKVNSSEKAQSPSRAVVGNKGTLDFEEPRKTIQRCIMHQLMEYFEQLFSQRCVFSRNKKTGNT